MILKPKKSDDPDSDVSRAKITYKETKDVEKACKCLNYSKNNCVEAKLLQGLVKEKENYVNALECVCKKCYRNVMRDLVLFDNTIAMKG